MLLWFHQTHVKNEFFIGVHAELEHCPSVIMITRVTTTHHTLFVEVDLGVIDPLVHLVFRNLKPSMATWLQLQQVVFAELFSMKSLLCPLMTVNMERLFPGTVLVLESAHPLPNCSYQWRLLFAVLWQLFSVICCVCVLQRSDEKISDDKASKELRRQVGQIAVRESFDSTLQLWKVFEQTGL